MTAFTFQNGLAAEFSRSKPAVPSKLSAFLICPLRYAFETESSPEVVVPRGPFALRGIALHRTVERYFGREVPGGRELQAEFLNYIGEEIARQKEISLTKFAFTQAGIKGILSNEQILSACQLARVILVSHQDKATPNPAVLRMPAMRGGAPALGSEKAVSSEALDMEGRIDLTYKDATDVVHVVDYKSGNVLDSTGVVKESYAIQVAAYAALVSDTLKPSGLVMDLIGPSSNWSGVYDAAMDRAIKELLSKLRTALPKHVKVRTELLAMPGHHCSSCAYRLFCPRYKEYMNPTSRGADDEALPNDVSGTILEARQSGGLITLRILTDKGTKASIAGVPLETYPALHTGQRLRAASLGTFDLAGKTAFPANFYLFRADNPRLSAFEAMMLST